MELNPYLVGLGTTALLLFVGHWFPWPHDLHRLAAYAYGVASILIGAGLWLGRVWRRMPEAATRGWQPPYPKVEWAQTCPFQPRGGTRTSVLTGHISAGDEGDHRHLPFRRIIHPKR